MPEPTDRPSLRARLRRRPALAAGAGTAVVVGIVVVLVWFQPHTLFIDRVVDEEFPVAVTTGAAADEADPEPDVLDEPEAAEPAALAAGTFSSRSRYSVVGSATTYELADGSRVLRLEDFEATNGPDLLVYLTVGDEADDDRTLGADVVDLGLLSGNIGNQNYEIPTDVDLDRYDTVVVWCRRFAVGFGAADLAPL